MERARVCGREASERERTRAVATLARSERAAAQRARHLGLLLERALLAAEARGLSLPPGLKVRAVVLLRRAAGAAGAR